jgi:precorrin-6B methylase 1
MERSQITKAKIALGYDRALARIEELSKMAHEDRELLEKRTTEEIIHRVAERQEKKKNKNGT